jgi:NADH-quinone oxidoreductase subunit E
MAWTVKPSATMKIERRAEPYLTPAMLDQYTREIIPKYATKLGALMPILHDVQDRYRHIPHQAMIEIAKFLQITPADVLDCASFYEEFHLEPVGKNVVAVCQSIACEVCGHQAILDHLRKKLDLEPHEASDDGRFTLLALECLGACDAAPVMLINGQLHENLTMQKVDQIIDALPK